MISLKVQIFHHFFFLFGFLFSLFLNFNSKIIYNKFKIIKFMGSFIIVIISFIVYFYFMQKIDNSYFSLYHLFMIIFGFIFNKFIKY